MPQSQQTSVLIAALVLSVVIFFLNPVIAGALGSLQGASTGALGSLLGVLKAFFGLNIDLLLLWLLVFFGFERVYGRRGDG